MNTNAKEQILTRSRSSKAEQRLKELGINLPAPPEPFGTYAEAVQTGNLLFLSGMLPTEGHGAKFIGRVGAELDVEADARRLISRHSMPSLSRGSIWDRSTKSRGSSGSACPSPLREMSAINRRSLTPLRSCCKTSSEKTRALAAWCMASQAFRSARRSNWKSYSKWEGRVIRVAAQRG